jgi:hypothetical protein
VNGFVKEVIKEEIFQIWVFLESGSYISQENTSEQVIRNY